MTADPKVTRVGSDLQLSNPTVLALRGQSNRRRYAGVSVEAIADADGLAVGYSADVSG